MSDSFTQNKINLRFRDQKLEQVYKAGSDRVIAQTLTMALYSTMIMWLVAIVLLFVLEFESRIYLTSVISLAIYPYCVFLLAIKNNRRVQSFIQLLAASNNISAGILSIYILNYIPNGINYMLPVLIFNVFFVTYQLRLRLSGSVFSSSTYLLCFLAYINLSEVDFSDQLIYSFLTVLTLFFVVSGSYAQENAERKLFVKNKLITKQANEIEIAHRELHEKNTEIVDSIKYAKRIQSAILPPPNLYKSHLKESFVLYKPKDIVAGDFYWIEPANERVLFAAADCTGHGVPGAMLSVVCNGGLNRSVREHGLTDPGKILDKTRELVIQEFEKSDEEIKDGMDIALCSLDGYKLQYAGAHNPLWIIRNEEVIETKADRQPISKFHKPLPYTTHTFDLEKGDTIYIFSDGYVDQFGGAHLPGGRAGGKKFMAKAFRLLLLSIQDKRMEEQQLLIDEAFENWRGNLEQTDDVCVIGVRV